MPVSKPSQTAEWADTASSPDIVAPSGGKQSLGWISAEFPPHNFFNWWQNLVGKWTAYLNDLADQAWTWTAAHTFQLPVTLSSTLDVAGTATFGANLVSNTNLVSTSTASFGGPTTFTVIPTITPAPTFTYPALQSGFGSDAGKNKIGYFRDVNGCVHVQGMAVAGSPVSCAATVFAAGVLPAPNGALIVPACVLDNISSTRKVYNGFLQADGSFLVGTPSDNSITEFSVSFVYHPSMAAW